MSSVLATTAPSVTTPPKRHHPADRLHVSITAPSEAITLCAVAGEVDFYTAEVLRSRLIGSLSTAAPTVVVDLSLVTFFGTDGLQVLIEARSWARRTGHRLELVTGPRCVDRLLEVAVDVATFETTASLADALLGALPNRLPLSEHRSDALRA